MEADMAEHEIDQQPWELEDSICTRTFKYDLTEEYIKVRLCHEYNTFPQKIQRGNLFFEQALEMLDNSVRPLDFYEQLRRRREEKLAELQKRFRRLSYHVIGKPKHLAPDPDSRRWKSAGAFSAGNLLIH